MSTPHHSTYQTFPETYETHPGEQHYYAEANDYPQARRADSPSRGQTTTYYVTEQPSDKDDGSEMSESQAYMDNNLEISSIADDDPQYTTTEGHEHTYLDMADKSKWKGKNLSYMTPQMLHAMKMSQTQSQNTYKKTYNESVKGKGSSATDTVETRRVRKLTTEQSLLNYHKDFENSKSKGYTAVTETPELQRIRQQSHRDVNYKKEFMEQKGHNIPVAETPDTVRVKKQQKIVSDIKYQEDREKLKGKATQVVDDPSTRRAMQAAKIASDIEYKKSKEKTEEMERKRQDINTTSQKSKAYKHVAAPGNIADYDPAKQMERMSMKDKHIYKAMFDYVAQDDDEVSFQDGDTIINAQRIDDGWMFGTVERTAQTGMLPSNYVQVIQ